MKTCRHFVAAVILEKATCYNIPNTLLLAVLPMGVFLIDKNLLHFVFLLLKIDLLGLRLHQAVDRKTGAFTVTVRAVSGSSLDLMSTVLQISDPGSQPHTAVLLHSLRLGDGAMIPHMPQNSVALLHFLTNPSA